MSNEEIKAVEQFAEFLKIQLGDDTIDVYVQDFLTQQENEEYEYLRRYVEVPDDSEGWE